MGTPGPIRGFPDIQGRDHRWGAAAFLHSFDADREKGNRSARLPARLTASANGKQRIFLVFFILMGEIYLKLPE